MSSSRRTSTQKLGLWDAINNYIAAARAVYSAPSSITDIPYGVYNMTQVRFWLVAVRIYGRRGETNSSLKLQFKYVIGNGPTNLYNPMLTATDLQLQLGGANCFFLRQLSLSGMVYSLAPTL